MARAAIKKMGKIQHILMDKPIFRPIGLPHIPQHILIGCTFFILFCIGTAIAISVRQPSLGITWAPSNSPHGLIVKKVNANIDILKPGDRIINVSQPGNLSIELRNEMIVADPDMYARYDNYNRFFRYQSDIAKVQKQPSIELTKENREKVIIHPQRSRRVSQLPFAFWLYNISGAVCFLIGVGVWSYRRGETTARLLATAGLGFFLAEVCLSIYTSREIGMNVDLFLALANINHFFMCLFTFSLLLLFWYYPIRLGNYLVVWVTYTMMFLFWLNITMQWVEFPFHAFYVPTFVTPYCIALPLSVIQWKKTAQQPVERAALKWFLLSILVSLGITTPLLLLPAIYEMSIEFPLWLATLLVLIMFSGLALGVLKYNLFRLERWWFLGWLFFGSYLLVLGIDILLIRLLQISPKESIVFVILGVLWVYFPLRQWFWNRWIAPPEYLLQSHLHQLIDLLFSSPSSQSLSRRWEFFLQQIFNPLDIRRNNQTLDSVMIAQNGQSMHVPMVNGDRCYELSYNQKGTKLFGHQEQKLAQFIYTMARESSRLKMAQELSADTERKRIMRDLHDDVSGKLLHLIHSTQSKQLAELARSAHKTLRETIYISLHGAKKPLDEIVATWRTAIKTRLETQNLTLNWNQSVELKDYYLTPRQHVNCGRILNEAVSNIINHSSANEITIAIAVARQNIGECHFTMRIRDNGQTTDISSWVAGVGLTNMRTRATELNGKIAWINNKQTSALIVAGITVEFSFPLDEVPSGPQSATTNGG